MKLVTILASFISTVAFGQTTQFMPDNDLWKYDSKEMPSAVDQSLFNNIVQAGREVYAPFAKKNNEKLVINALWTNSTVNANCCRGCQTNTVTVNMYGGLARRPEVNAAGFALVLCHELGHAYGGTPYISPARQMSAEGQSDYYATKECYEMVVEKVPALQEMNDKYAEIITEKCEKYTDETKYNNCLNGIEGGLSLAKLLANLSGDPVPQIETPDSTIVTTTQTSYPETTQCRLDTYVAGALKLDRPLCWFKPDSILPPFWVY